MADIKSIYNSFDELYETMLRGNEIEFEYDRKCYFLLPYFEQNRVVGTMIGEKDKEEVVCMSKEELYNLKIANSLFGEIVSRINILWYDF